MLADFDHQHGGSGLGPGNSVTRLGICLPSGLRVPRLVMVLSGVVAQ